MPEVAALKACLAYLCMHGLISKQEIGLERRYSQSDISAPLVDQYALVSLLACPTILRSAELSDLGLG